MAEYISGIKSIEAPTEAVFAKLNDLRGLSQVAEVLGGHQELSQIEIEVIDSDNCAFVLPMAGRLHLRIVDREPNKTIKLEAVESPIPLTLWIQLVEGEGGAKTHLRLTLRAELNFMLKQMLGSKLQDGVDKLATMMASLPYV